MDSREKTPDAMEILATLAKERRSGVLAMQLRKAGANICLQEGRVVFATSNIKRFQPGRWLVDAGLASEMAMQQVGRVNGTKEMVESLMNQGAKDRAALVTALRALIREITLDALNWTRPGLRFSPGVPVLREQLLLDESLTAMLDEAEQRLEARGREENYLPAGRSRQEVGGDPHATNPEVMRFRSMVEEARAMSHYQLLETDNSADAAAIRRNYYQVARSYHPDALQGVLAEACREDAEEYFAMVTEAYNTLTRPEQRKEYDQQLYTESHREQKTQNPAELAQSNYQQGRRALAKGEFHDAMRFFQNAVQLDGSKGEYHRELGIVQMRNPRWQKPAETALSRAIEIEQTDVRALVHLGLLYKKNGLKRRAVETFHQALQWDPENSVAVESLAQLEPSAEEPGGRLKGLFGRRP